METPTSLKIVKLEANNIMRLKAVAIDSAGKPVVIVSGENDQGKSSVLNSIAFALGGKDMIAEVPIRVGSSKGKIVVDLGEFKVTRSFSSLGGSTLVIEDTSGSPVRSPQTLLDKLCSKIAFDPLAFVRMKPAEQLETLRRLVGLDFTALDSARKKAYDERTLVNRDLATAKARAAECDVDPETPDEEVSVTELTKTLTAANEHNKAIESAARQLGLMKESEAESVKDIDHINKDIEALLKRVEELRGDVSNETKSLEYKRNAIKVQSQEVSASKPIDTAVISAKINAAGSINAKVRDKKRFKELQAEVEDAQKKTDALTEEIESFDKEKSDQLAAAKFPLKGLSFDETGVLLNGVPFTQGSQARQLQAAVAIGIAMNPKVRVILIRDGSLLDEKSLALVSEMAAQNDCQIWIEIVSSDDPAAIVIEDGQVKEAV